MDLQLKDPRPASADALLDFQHRLGVELPADHRRFLLDINGGHVTGPLGLPDDGPRPGVGVGVTALLGVGRGDSLDILFRQEQYASRVPAGLIPIADAEGGDLLCLSVRPRDHGEVLLWEHEWESEEGEAPTERNLVAVAASFTAFLAALTDAEDDDLPHDIVEVWVAPGFLATLQKDGEGRA